jgi:hypothetical protein
MHEPDFWMNWKKIFDSFRLRKFQNSPNECGGGSRSKTVPLPRPKFDAPPSDPRGDLPIQDSEIYRWFGPLTGR